jgi:DNA-binding CsgD family transcriptional regulator/ligand-binding sensor domain-containing protein
MLKYFCLSGLFLLGFSLFCFAQIRPISRVGSPLIQSYQKQIYQGGNQNWAIDHASNGVIYIGNADGLLSFDGHYWQLHTLPNKSTVRSVAVDKQDRIFTGGFADFGYWEVENGRLLYQSISELLPKDQRPTDEIWRILIDGDRVLFQSFASLYLYENGKVFPITSGLAYLFAHAARNRIFVELIPSGLYELKGKQLTKLADRNQFGSGNIMSMLPFGDNEILLATAKSGLFILQKDGQIRPWQNQAHTPLQQAQLNNGIQLDSIHYAFGTILNGIFLLNKDGILVQHLNKQQGLQNNTVLSLDKDPQHNIWAGLDNGLDRIEFNSPFSFYTDYSGKIGTVYASIIFEGNIYLGTNQGLYFAKWNPDGAYQALQFNLVPGSQGQVWELNEWNGELLCGHNDGTFKVKGNQFVPISTITGGWITKTIPNHPNTLLQGTYTGLVKYDRSKGLWLMDKKLEGYQDPIQYLEHEQGLKLWASSYKGLRLLTLDPTLDKVVDHVLFDKEKGALGQSPLHVFNLHGTTVFTSDSGFMRYDRVTDRLLRYDELNNQLGSFAFSNKVILAENQNYWLIHKTRIAYVRFQKNGKLEVDSTRFASLNGRMMKNYESINHVHAGLYLISLDNGFAIYQQQDPSNKSPILPKPLIRSLHYMVGKSIPQQWLWSEDLLLPTQTSQLRIEFAMPWHSASPVRFQYFVKGYSETWSDWSPLAFKELAGLSHGNYQFQVRARTAEGQLSDIAQLEFSIQTPWYLSWWAYVLYVLLVLALLWFARTWYRQKLITQQERIRREMAQKQEALLRKEAEENEQRLIVLKNQQLEKELESTSRELANSAMNIVYKNELLNKLHSEIKELRDADGRRLSADHLHKINNIIDDAHNDERDWIVFENSFNEAHENFFKKLKSNHPDLVPNDLKLCAYLRMNMSSKEIASLLNITTRGVEIRRYRLRKKLGLNHQKNLVEFLLEL